MSSDIFFHVHCLVFKIAIDMFGSLFNTKAVSSGIQRKLVVKLIQRLGIVLLPRKVPTWIYHRGIADYKSEQFKTDYLIRKPITGRQSQEV